MALTTVIAGKIAGFDSTSRDALLSATNSHEVVTSGAVSTNTLRTDLSVTDTVAFTLADGTVPGQRKLIRCTVASGTPIGTLTIATPEDTAGLVCASTFIFNTVGQAIELEWSGTKWRCTRIQAAGRDTPAAASTLNQLVAVHNIAITGTQDWVLGAGSCVGQRQTIMVASAASIPVGTVSGLFYDEDGSADGIDLNFDAAADIAVVEWGGTRWIPVFLVSATVST